MMFLERVSLCSMLFLPVAFGIRRLPGRMTESSSMQLPGGALTELSSTSLTSGVDDTPSAPECGAPPLGRIERVVGGTSASKGQWPWQVVVKEEKYFGTITAYKCGGVLISDRHILTAAHCEPRSIFTKLTVTLGQYAISEDNVQTIPVSKMIIHKEFNTTDFNNDLAVLELKHPVRFTSRVSPICLPDFSDDFIGQTGHVTGWGKLSYGGRFPRVLQSAALPIIEREKCKRMFRERGHHRDIHDHFLCAGYESGKIDACEGDSGGPLSVQRASGQWVLAGTVSYGVKCAEPGLPGVYVNIPHYKSWIQRAMSTRFPTSREPTQGLLDGFGSFFSGESLDVVHFA